MKIKPIDNLYDYEQTKRFIEQESKKNNLSEDERNKIRVFNILIEEFQKRGKFDPKDVTIEPLIDNVWQSVKEVSKYEQKGLIQRGLKLGEEYGELSAEILKFVGYKKSSETEDEIRKKILLESTDCLIMILDIIINMEFNKEEICNMSEKQIKKWLNNINENEKSLRYTQKRI